MKIEENKMDTRRLRGVMTELPYEISAEDERAIKDALEGDYESAASLFKVLSDPTRLKILHALEVREVCVCILVELLGQQHSTLSYHLKLLKDEGLVDSMRSGSFQTYVLTKKGQKLLSALKRLF